MLDASAAISWFFVDERDRQSVAMANAVAEHGALVPALFRWEIQNGLMSAVRTKRMTLDGTLKALESLDDLGLQVDEVILKSSLAAGIGLASRFGLTAYDAAYLELAVRKSLPLMTRDARLAQAAADLQLSWQSA